MPSKTWQSMLLGWTWSNLNINPRIRSFIHLHCYLHTFVVSAHCSLVSSRFEFVRLVSQPLWRKFDLTDFATQSPSHVGCLLPAANSILSRRQRQPTFLGTGSSLEQFYHTTSPPPSSLHHTLVRRTRKKKFLAPIPYSLCGTPFVSQPVFSLTKVF